MDKYLIIGLGVFGKELATNLIEKGAEVIVVDKSMTLVEEMQDMVTYAVKLDATDESALSALGVADIDVAVVCIGEHFESNLLAAVNLKHLGVKKVIARASDPVHVKILRAVGVDMIITPEVEAAEKLSYRLMHKGLIDITFIGDGNAAAKVAAPKVFIGKSIAQIALRVKYGVNLIAIQSPRKEDKDGTPLPPVINNNPSADTIITEGDIMIVIGSNRDLQNLTKL